MLGSTSQLTISGNAPAAKQAVILHDGPANPDVSLLGELHSLGIGAVYFTDVAYADGLPTEWTTFVADVKAEN